MNIDFINKSSYNILLLRNDNAIGELSADSSAIFDIKDGDKITFCPQGKNHVYINFLFALIDGFISEENIINDLICRENIYFSDFDDNSAIEIYDFECRLDEKGFIYDTVKIKSFGALNIQTSYQIETATKEYKKTMFFLCIISSWLPIIFVLLVFYFLFKSIYIIFGVIALFLAFTLPSFIKAKRIKKYYSTDFVNEYILLELKKEKNPVPPKNIFNKAIDNTVTNILDKFFKKK